MQLASLAPPRDAVRIGCRDRRLAKSNGVRRFGVGVDIEAEQARERIDLEQAALRRDDDRGDAARRAGAAITSSTAAIGRNRFENRRVRRVCLGDDASRSRRSESECQPS